ncbi:MAG: HAMP domain-containing sensor histidine kinase [Pseudomonadota bacterium]
MSSARNNTLGSAVFQQTLIASGIFVLVSLALIWAICGFLIWQIDRDVAADIDEAILYAEETYYGRGVDVLIEEAIQDDTDIIWSEDYLYEILESQQLIWVLRDADYEPIAGYPGLHGDEGWSTSWVDHPEIGQEVRGQRVYLRGGDSLSVAAFIPERRVELIGFGIFTTLALLLIVLPLSLITGYFVSGRVFRRIEDISATAAAVGAGEMTTRAPLTGRHDEFDRLAGSINGMLDEVSALNSNVEAISVGVAHDLRTPLTNIGGRLELIRRDQADPDAVDGHVDAAENAQAQLLRIFDALLRLGEVKAGKRKAAFDTVDLSSLLKDLTEAYDPVLVDAHKTFTPDIAPGLSIQGDRELLEQMIFNLLENAVEHSRDAAKVFASLKHDGDATVVRIGDDGPGISPADRDRIFDRFFRADASRSTPGSGLGLSLVQAIAEMHGATVTLDPDATGAIFTIRFPDPS